MSSKNETRIVSIRFDNKDFERNVQQSLDTLTRLNKALEFENGSKGLDAVSSAASRVDMSSLSSAVEETSSRFSKLEVIGITALANITNTAVNAGKKLLSTFIQPLTTGGLERAMNMEKANFMFEGLGFAAGKVGEVGSIMDNIYKSVEGTIYSLDRASVLASQLMASGVEAVGKDAQITHVLKAVAGVASMYSADYERVGEIFATVKAQGYLMGNQVDSLRTMGLPVWKKLADYLNEAHETNKYTEETVKDMISDREIDFQTFSDAMESAFGEQAGRSKEMFIGALEDMKAAAARIGEAFYKPILVSGRDFFNASVPLLDAIKSRLTNDDLTGPIDKFGLAFQSMVNKVITGMDLLGAALNFDNTKEELEALVKSGLADQSRVDNLTKYASKIEAIRTVLGKLKTVFDFLKTTLLTVWNIVSKIFTALSPIGKLGLDIAAGIGMLIDKLGNAIEYMNKFSKSAGDFVDSLGESLKNSQLLAIASDKIHGFFKSLDGIAADLGASLETLSEHISKVVYNLTDGLFNALQRAKEGFGQLLSISDTISTVLGLVLASKFSQLGAIFSGGAKEGTSFFLILKKLGLNTLAKLQAASGAVYDSMLELQKTMEVYQRSLKADVLLKIGIAIGVIAMSVKILSTIDTTALAQSVAALGILAVILKKTLGSVVGTIKMLSLMSWKDLAGFALMQEAMIKIGIALLSMAGAVKMLASLDLQSAVQGIVSLWLLSKILVKVMKELSSIPKLNFLTINLTFISIAITMLAFAMRLIGTMNWEQAAVGAVGIIVLSQALVAAMKHLAAIEKSSKGVNPLSLLAVALAIDMMALAFYALSKISWEGIGKAVVSMIVVISSLVILMDAMNKLNGKGDPMKNAGSLLVVSIALKLLAGSFIALGSLEWGQIGRAAVGMGILFMFITMLTDMMSTIQSPTDMISRIGSLLGIAFSIKMLASVFQDLGSMDFEQIGRAASGLFVIGLFLTAMIGISQLAANSGGGKNLLVMAGAMIALGFALQVFAIGVAALSMIPIETLAVSLIAFIAAIVALSYVATAVQGSLVAMLELAGTMIAFGVALAIIGGSMLIIGYGLSVLAESLNMLTGDTAIKFAALVVILAVLSPLLESAGIGMALFGVGIAAVGIGMILVGAGLIAIGVGLKVITTSMEEVVNSINAFENINWNAVGNLAALITIFGLLSPLAIALGLALISVGAGLALIALGIGGIASGFALVRRAISSIFSTIDTKISAICDKASNKLALFKDTVKDFSSVVKLLLDALKVMIKGVNDLKDEAYNSGKNVVDGLINGMNANKSRAIAAANSLAKETLQAYKRAMGISSPSKEMAKLGGWTVAGLVKGVEDNSSSATTAMRSFAKAVLMAYSSFDESVVTDPVITPVLDLSNIEAGAKYINGELSTVPTTLVPYNGIANASIAASGFATTKSESMDNQIGVLAKRIGAMTDTMNSRSLNVYNTIDGTADPEAFADGLIRSFRLNARTT